VKILVAANIVPFLGGGADYHIEGLAAALRQHGHEVACLRFPFKFGPPSQIERLMDLCEDYDLNRPNGVRVDCLISLQFPAYGVLHDNHRVWVMHQHRAAYELYDHAAATDDEARLRERIHAYDNRVLSRIAKRFANSRRVAERLQECSGLSSEPLYHPPAHADRFFCEAAEPYIFCPSRLESLKRQDLLIRAVPHIRSPVGLLIAGDGGQHANYERLIESVGVGNRVRLLGHITETEKCLYYARSLGVFFGPKDEDYGYVTLEAMLSSKPIITCTDSGGPLELVLDGHTGLVVPPSPEAVAEAIDRLYADRAWAEDLGRSARRHYDALGIAWSPVVDHLLS
jgi:glycosyltransferase involved in cell wall biosynthesis